MGATETMLREVMGELDGALHHDIDIPDIAAVVEALERAHYAVVELPPPDEREDGYEFTDFPGSGLYVPVVFDDHPGEVQIRAGAWCDEPLSVTEARELAASILAAADYAEEVSE